MEIIKSDQAPQAIGPYSQAIKVGNIIYCSGQIALDPTTMQIVNADIEAETIRVCENIKGLLESNDLKLENVVKNTIFITDINYFDTVNRVYNIYFGHKPARSCVQVSALPKGAKIEIEAIAEIS